MEWQPIETAPKDGTDILGCWHSDNSGKSHIAVIRWYDYGDEMFAWYGATPDGIVLTGATHWMPLPAPPTQGENQ